ncbi:MAG: hypothetical protein PHE73_03200 [Sulfurovaceae bacterium]|nr:hypothetical protein [Sulfurovaceae bacterium]
MNKILIFIFFTFSFVLNFCFADTINDKTVSAYKIGKYVDVKSATEKLASAGFEVVGTYPSFDNGTTILYTNSTMKADASKNDLGFAAVGRILIDEENHQIHIDNPVYFGAAFLRSNYNHAHALNILSSLEKVFGTLKNSDDAYEFEELPKYHFMIGMPYYNDMNTIAQDSTTKLVAKAKASKDTISIVQIDKNRYVAFMQIDKRTSSFVKKIGVQNSEILPWAVLIENGKAKALNAKYLIAISYPLLTMTEFMTIATVPDAITQSLKRSFK